VGPRGPRRIVAVITNEASGGFPLRILGKVYPKRDRWQPRRGAVNVFAPTGGQRDEPARAASKSSPKPVVSWDLAGTSPAPIVERAARIGAATLPPLLEVVDLHKSFGPVSVLRGADLALEVGEVLALVGDNGAGKSTLIKHIAGVHKADSGEIRLNGAPLDLHAPADARALGIETVYQDLALADDLSVGANVFLGREPIKRFLGLPVIDNRKIREETDALLSRIESRIPPRRALFRACPADRDRRSPSPARSTGSRRSSSSTNRRPRSP
jgi:ABC-type multidrug transport system fused ATPase/permease subunit